MGGRRKPAGGGPEGVAFFWEVVVRRALVAGEWVGSVERRKGRVGRVWVKVARARVRAIVWCGMVVRGERKRWRM